MGAGEGGLVCSKSLCTFSHLPGLGWQEEHWAQEQGSQQKCCKPEPICRHPRLPVRIPDWIKMLWHCCKRSLGLLSLYPQAVGLIYCRICTICSCILHLNGASQPLNRHLELQNLGLIPVGQEVGAAPVSWKPGFGHFSERIFPELHESCLSPAPGCVQEQRAALGWASSVDTSSQQSGLEGLCLLCRVPAVQGDSQWDELLQGHLLCPQHRTLPRQGLGR